MKPGDFLNIDVTVFYKGFHGDCSEMFEVGPVDDAGKKLIAVTYGAWQEAAKFCEPGKQYRDIGGIIEDYAAQHGLHSEKFLWSWDWLSM